MKRDSPIKSVAVIGAGASGTITAAALKAEQCFDNIRVFERRESAGGTWIYDNDPGTPFELRPGSLPPETDPPIEIPNHLPTTTSQSSRQRYEKTPIYEDLTTNVPAIAMAFSDIPFQYGPFVPHWIPKQYIENYFSAHRTDSSLVLNTTVEDVSKLPTEPPGKDRWSLTLRRSDPVRRLDVWWKEEFDALVIANGHYSVPFLPKVKGLEEYLENFPDRVIHSKIYRSPSPFVGKKVLVIGNSASGHDISLSLLRTAKLPVYQSRRSRAFWEGPEPPAGIEWKPVINEYIPSSGAIVFSDGTVLTDIDHVIYCTGYKVSFPFWNIQANGGNPIWDYENNKVVGSYLHTFFQEHPTLGIVGLPRTLTFRGFEYQAIAIARVFAGRSSTPLPSKQDQEKWETERWELVQKEKKKFHDLLPWESGETLDFLHSLYNLAGLPTLEGKGRAPPVLDSKTRWALKNVKKYLKGSELGDENDLEVEDDWTIIGGKAWEDYLQFL